MVLYIVRHAWAGSYGDPEWPDDFERPLEAAGKKRFAKVAGALVERGVAPTLVATSPLVRCRQTAEILAEAVGSKASLVLLDELQPGSDLEALVPWTAEQAKRHDEIAWVGHAPDVGRMAGALIGQTAWVRFAKGATASICFYEEPAPAAGELRWLVTAKMLGC
jgi:phosphohistidine phosphatase